MKMKLLFLASALVFTWASHAEPKVPEERDAFKEYIRQLHKQSADGDYSAGDEIRRLRIEGYGYKEDYVNVYELMDLAERREDPDMHFAVASALYHGKGGFKADHMKAREGYERAASMGHSSGAFNLGLMLLEGEGGEADLEQAFERFERAHKLGHKQAMAEMGIARFKQGRIEECIAYLEQAPPDGDVWNHMFLGDALKALAPSRENRQRALRSYKKASDRGLLNAHFEIAAMLIDPEQGLELDPEGALTYLNRALDSEIGWAWNKFRDDYLQRGEAESGAKAGPPQDRSPGSAAPGRAVLERVRLAQDYRMKAKLRTVLEKSQSSEELTELLEKINRRANEEVRASSSSAKDEPNSQ